MGRPPCCDKANVKRGLWTAEEDAKILAYVANHGIGNWTQVPKKAGLNRCGKSCRLRWTNYLRPDLKHEEFTEQEEKLIVQFHAAIGSRWSLIAKQLPGRTDNDVKNYWNTKLKKKLIKMNIDPITHKPFSQIFSDFESISCLTTNHKNTPNSVSSQSEVTSAILPGTLSGSIGRVPMFDQLYETNSSSNSCLTQQMSQLEISENGCFEHFKLEVVSPSSSSSSSSSITNGKSTPGLVMPGSCNWGDQSFDNPLPATNVIEEEYNIQKFLETNTSDLNCVSHTNSVMNDKSGTSDFKVTGGVTESSNCYEPSSSVNSFVKALLDRDSEMQLDFPSFDDILDY